MYIRKKVEFKTRYGYYPEFDGWDCTLEQAYKFYEDDKLIHLFKDGVIKCYKEFPRVLEETYQIGDLVLTDFI